MKKYVEVKYNSFEQIKEVDIDLHLNRKFFRWGKG